jgi:hypothetical protein
MVLDFAMAMAPAAASVAPMVHPAIAMATMTKGVKPADIPDLLAMVSAVMAMARRVGAASSNVTATAARPQATATTMTTAGPHAAIAAKTIMQKKTTP